MAEEISTTEEEVVKDASNAEEISKTEEISKNGGDEVTNLRKALDNSRSKELINRRKVERLEDELKSLARLSPDLKDLREAAKQRDEYKVKLDASEKARSEWEGKHRNSLIDTELNTVLTELKAKDVNTAKKLLDRAKIVWKDDKLDSESLKALALELVKSDPILFDTAAVSVKRAGEQVSQAGFAAEMNACKTQAEIKAVLKKYGKQQ